jgi:hypothetical protein
MEFIPREKSHFAKDNEQNKVAQVLLNNLAIPTQVSTREKL